MRKIRTTYLFSVLAGLAVLCAGCGSGITKTDVTPGKVIINPPPDVKANSQIPDAVKGAIPNH